MELSPGTVAPDPKHILVIVFFDCGFGFAGPAPGVLSPIAFEPDEPDDELDEDEPVEACLCKPSLA